MDVPEGFYSYLWLREDGTPYYAGKGKGRRAFMSWAHGVHKPADRTRILVFPMLHEADAFESEIAFIDLFGRKDNGTGILRNLTNGGEGAAVHVVSLAARQKASASLRGRSFSDIHRFRLSQAGKVRTKIYGRVPSDETRKKISDARQGFRYSLESRKKMRDSGIRRCARINPMNEELKEKLRIMRAGRPGKNLGAKLSEETKRKMSEAHKKKNRYFRRNATKNES